MAADGTVAVSMRIRLILNMLVFLSVCPLFAFAWYADDVLFRGYRSVSISRPLFSITAACSGSTQLTDATRSEFLERKELHPFKPETYEVIFSGSQLVNHCLTRPRASAASSTSFGSRPRCVATGPFPGRGWSTTARRWRCRTVCTNRSG